MGYTHFDQVSGINGLGVGPKDNEIVVANEDGQLRQEGVPILTEASEMVFNQRIRVTLAEVNAGVTVLPAIAGRAYRLVDFTVIAIGGAAAALTALEVRGTRAAAAVIIASIAQANLTRSTLLKPNSTGVTVLADGASFTALDAGAAVTVIKDGADMTTATHIDVILSGVIE